MRIIDKLPKAPKFNENIVKLITAFLFLKDADFKTIKPDSAIQIMGNIAFLDNLSSKSLEVAKTNPSHDIIISGGINPVYKENNQETNLVKMLYSNGGKRNWNDVLNMSEAEIINRELNQKGLTNNTKLETNSTNSKENFQNTTSIGYYEEAQNLYIITSKENTLHAKLTASKYATQFKYKNIATIGYISTVDAMGIKVDEEHWADNELSKQYVYGEFLRVVKYSEMGEIPLTRTKLNELNNIIVALQQLEK